MQKIVTNNPRNYIKTRRKSIHTKTGRTCLTNRQKEGTQLKSDKIYRIALGLIRSDRRGLILIESKRIIRNGDHTHFVGEVDFERYCSYRC